MTARICDGCNQVIDQKNDEYLEIAVRVLDAAQDHTQDGKEQAYADFCDRCIANGVALKYLLKAVDWTISE